MNKRRNATRRNTASRLKKPQKSSQPFLSIWGRHASGCERAARFHSRLFRHATFAVSARDCDTMLPSNLRIGYWSYLRRYSRGMVNHRNRLTPSYAKFGVPPARKRQSGPDLCLLFLHPEAPGTSALTSHPSQCFCWGAHAQAFVELVYALRLCNRVKREGVEPNGTYALSATTACGELPCLIVRGAHLRANSVGAVDLKHAL